MKPDRRTFLKLTGAVPAAAAAQPAGTAAAPAAPSTAAPRPARIQWPRTYTGAHIQQIAFPLGGIAAGSISLGGRGQLRDWEIFNRPDKGNEPAYSICSIWAQLPGKKPVAKIAEARYLPPYEGASGLGWNNAPGLPRLDGAAFTGKYPMAQIDFRDRKLPVKLSLEAFTPIFPLDADASGLPAFVLRYKVTNPNAVPAHVALCYTIDNPVDRGDQRVNEKRESGALKGLIMTNPSLAADHVMRGDFTLAALGDGEVSIWRGAPKGRWWSGPLLFWDEFSAKGRLEAEPAQVTAVGAVCIRREIPAGGQSDFTFVLAWHFPNRTPERCGWTAPKGLEKSIIGNHYCTRYKDSWAAAEALARDLEPLEKKTRAFIQAVDQATLPGSVKDAAMSNLSTLATTTSFRTADGEFKGFEGVNNKAGCCFGSCTHVWNYETTTAHVFPSLSLSLRKSAFGYPMDERGAMFFREMLPPGKGRSDIVATDGQMGQIMKVYLDWKLSGNNDWLREMWPKAKKALEFAWLPGSWDADRDGVTEGVQHNTYDVEFYGPNPQCSVYYLGALRACEEMAKAANDDAYARQCRDLFQRGSQWIDANLFNGEYYVQKIKGAMRADVASGLISNMGSENTEQPEFQVGEGCLVDQLIGQYQADVCGLGPLLKPENIRKAMASIWRYNWREDLSDHIAVQRIYALGDEAGLLICDYGKAERPRVPFPYYAEVWTGLEYSIAALMIWNGLVAEGIRVVEGARLRHDGERRNPFDEPECGHHYARALSAWSPVLALCGFSYDAPNQRLDVSPRQRPAIFRGFWSNASGWGTFELGNKLTIRAEAGELRIRELSIRGRAVKLAKPALITPTAPFTV